MAVRPPSNPKNDNNQELNRPKTSTGLRGIEAEKSDVAHQISMPAVGTKTQ
jgi:hypothetical protein